MKETLFENNFGNYKLRKEAAPLYIKKYECQINLSTLSEKYDIFTKNVT